MRSCSSALASRALARICSAADDRFLLFALGDDAGTGPRFVDHLLRFAVALGQDFLVALLGFRELLFDLLGIEKPFRDPLPALFQHLEDRLVGELPQEQRDDDKADHLREEDPEVETKSFSRFAHEVA